MIAAGIYCIFNPDITGLAIGYIIGVSMVVDAIGRIYAWFQLKKEGQADGWLLASGILSALFGILLIVDVAAQLYMDMFIAYIAACWIMVQAIITIIRAFRARKIQKTFDTRYIGYPENMLSRILPTNRFVKRLPFGFFGITLFTFQALSGKTQTTPGKLSG